MLFLQDVAYAHPNRDMLFEQINISINKNEKVSLIGHNGTGKSTLLKLMAGILQPTSGQIKSESIPYYMPQLVGQANDLTIAQALHIDQKINALKKILNGEVTDEYLESIGDDWSVEERCAEAFANWELDLPDLSQPMHTLSGGQKPRYFWQESTFTIRILF